MLLTSFSFSRKKATNESRQIKSPLKDETILHIETPCIDTFKRLNNNFEDTLKDLSIDEFLSTLTSLDGQFRIKFENDKFIGVIVDRWILYHFSLIQKKKYQKK